MQDIAGDRPAHHRRHGEGKEPEPVGAAALAHREPVADDQQERDHQPAFEQASRQRTMMSSAGV